MSPTPAAPATDRRSARAATILDAARQLILRQGFKAVTMAAVAEHAHVGKGTAYQYWRTKEDLFLELVAGELAGVLTDLAERVRAEPALARPDLLCDTVTRSWLSRPLVRALQTSDDFLLGGLLDQPGAAELTTRHGAGAILRDLLPLWRSCEVLRTDWSAEDQANAIALLVIGSFATDAHRLALTTDADWSRALRLAIQGALRTEDPAQSAAPRLAEEVIAVLTGHAEQIRASVG